ncbi:MAG: hypothetical protein AAF628_03430 [Planctomycetota bacterium]
MGALLAVLVFLAFFYESSTTTVGTGSAVHDAWEATPVPELDPALLAEASDGTRADRLTTEPQVLRHLLEKSLDVSPAVARKLGMPERMVSVASLRQSVPTYRGRYLWYKGRLEYRSPAKAGHPVSGYDYYEGRIRTAAGEEVLFVVSVPPDEEVRLGTWVRVEGYFLKLRDAHLPEPLDRAPLLVGPQLLRAYPDWQAVDALEPDVLARVRDGEWADGRLVPGADMDKLLAESQDVPLWHLASYAMHREATESAEAWKDVPPFVTKEQFDRFRRGEVPKGERFRVMGTFILARVMPADVNPLGIETWTEAWIQVRDLGGKTIPIWLPGRVGREWKRNQSVICRGFFFRRYQYRALEGQVRWTPLFVAATLDRFELSGDPLTNQITYAFAGLVLVVGLVFFFMTRRDRREHQRHAAELVARRRRRRGRADPLAVAPAAPHLGE